MHYVYIIQTVANPKRRYTGLSDTPPNQRRLDEHNNGQTSSTKNFRPWELLAWFALPSTEAASHFEKYLKSGSGREFIRRHILREPGL